MKPPAAREAINLLRTMTWVLCAVGALALVFTTVNVTRFATSRDVPWQIAILLDPMIGTALAGVLYVDARLAAWGIRPPAWSTALRWSAGCTAALMNTWESLWPDGQIGWPRLADPAAVLLHLTPALLLILLTETIAAYRRTVTDLLSRVGVADAAQIERPLTNEQPPPAALAAEPMDTRPPPLTTPATALSGADGALAPCGHAGPYGGDVTAPTRPGAPLRLPESHGATDGDKWLRAVALDAAARTATGRPASIWRLRTDLHIGPRRARQIRDQLLARHHDPSPPAE
ncbi:extensin [Streptomyces sp. NPDC042319]|uniref:extensin n=1 Tax=Streptomyces sp. NPDC042319 TaxID=3154332 RepID=UPI0033BFD56A